MKEGTIVDKDYLEAFNLGYELAKELNLKSPMFKDLNIGNNRMNAMQAGMAQYNQEITFENEKEILQSLSTDKDKDNGLDLSI